MQIGQIKASQRNNWLFGGTKWLIYHSHHISGVFFLRFIIAPLNSPSPTWYFRRNTVQWVTKQEAPGSIQISTTAVTQVQTFSCAPQFAAGGQGTTSKGGCKKPPMPSSLEVLLLSRNCVTSEEAWEATSAENPSVGFTSVVSPTPLVSLNLLNLQLPTFSIIFLMPFTQCFP